MKILFLKLELAKGGGAAVSLRVASGDDLKKLRINIKGRNATAKERAKSLDSQLWHARLHSRFCL